MARPFKADENKPVIAGTPVKSPNLSDRAAQEWDRLAGELAEAGILVTKAHRAAMTLASTVAADIAEGWEAVKRDGAYIPTKSGLAAHPATKRIDALRRDYIKVLALLGLKSAVAGEKPDEVDEMADLIND